MVYVTVAGENAAALGHSMNSVLARLCTVLQVEQGSLQAPAAAPELLLWRGCGDRQVQAPHCILVFGEPSHNAEHIEVPEHCVVVAGCEDEAATGYAARRGLRLLDCGLSSKASLTFSSIGRESGVISLQRGVADLNGHTIEPLELPLGFAPKPYYPLLASVGVLLLAGMGERLQNDPSAKIWI